MTRKDLVSRIRANAMLSLMAAQMIKNTNEAVDKIEAICERTVDILIENGVVTLEEEDAS